MTLNGGGRDVTGVVASKPLSCHNSHVGSLLRGVQQKQPSRVVKQTVLTNLLLGLY